MRLFPVEDAQHDVLAVDGRLRGDAEIDRPAVEIERDAAVLRRARLGDVHAAHHLQAHRHAGPVVLVQAADLPQHAVDAVADAQERVLRLEVDVRGAALHRVGEQRVRPGARPAGCTRRRRLAGSGSRSRRSRSRAGCRRPTARGRSTDRCASSSCASPASTVLDLDLLAERRAQLVERDDVGHFGDRDRQRRASLLSKAIGSTRWRRAKSCGTSFSASPSTMICVEVDALLADGPGHDVADRRLGDEAERTSSRPSGACWFFCSVSAMRSWSAVMSPCWINSSPRRSFFRCSAMTCAELTDQSPVPRAGRCARSRGSDRNSHGLSGS